MTELTATWISWFILEGAAFVVLCLIALWLTRPFPESH